MGSRDAFRDAVRRIIEVGGGIEQDSSPEHPGELVRREIREPYAGMVFTPLGGHHEGGFELRVEVFQVGGHTELRLQFGNRNGAFA